MSCVNPAWLEHQRRRWLRTNCQLYVRHDANRFAPPSVQTKSFAARRIEQRQAEEQAALAAEQDALCEDLAHLRWLVADLKFDLAWRRLCASTATIQSSPACLLATRTEGSGRATAAVNQAQALHRAWGSRYGSADAGRRPDPE